MEDINTGNIIVLIGWQSVPKTPKNINIEPLLIKIKLYKTLIAV